MSAEGWGSGWDNQVVSQVIIVGPGPTLLVYSPTAGHGNLIASIAASSGTDFFGNTVEAGIVSYGPADADLVKMTGPAVDFEAPIGTPVGTLQASSVQMRLGTSSGLPLYIGSAGSFANDFAIVPPSGDTTGVTDLANITAGFTATGTVVLCPGLYYVDNPIAMKLGQYLRGGGRFSTTIYSTSAVSDVATIRVSSATGSSVSNSAGVSDLSVDGSKLSASVSGIGISFGDMSIIELREVAANNFTGTPATGTGFYGLNEVNFCEQLHGTLYSENCNQSLTFDGSGTGGGDFERMDVVMYASPASGGYHLTFRNGAFTLGSRIALRGNVNGAGGAGSGGAIIAFGGTGTNFIETSHLDVQVENDATSGTAAQTIFFNSSSDTITRCYGVMDFLLGGGAIPWTASNNNGNFNFNGRITTDNALLQKIDTIDWASITTGFPTGWSGAVKLKNNSDSGDVTIVWELTIAVGTVVTSGETILASGTIPSEYVNPGGRNCNPTELSGGGLAGGVFAGYQVTSTGGLLFQGAGFTVAGSSAFSFGQAIYNNTV